MIKKVIQKYLQEVCKKNGINDNFTTIELEYPNNPKFGDYSTNIALQLSKIQKKSPLDIAKKIIKNLPQDKNIEKFEVVKPGFINFWLSKKFLTTELKNIINDRIFYPLVSFGKNKKVMVEFAHPNTHKLFHIGHLRNISIGESLARILEVVSNNVVRTNYQGDVGLHIAKCLYQLQKIKEKIKSLKTLEEKIEIIGKAYTQGQKAYESDKSAKEEILKINKMIYEGDPLILPLWQETRQWSLDYFSKIYSRVNTQFDRLYFESEMTKRAIEICHQLLKKGILEKSQGAIIFNGKKYGLDTRVFINASGFPTYEGKELALAEKEFTDFGEIDKCIHVVTPEQTSFFKVTFKVEELISPKTYKDKQYHLAYEWVELKTGKMSSREGNIIEANWLIDEVKKRIQERFKSEDKIAEILAVSSVKYSFLKNSIKNKIAFDIEESISLEGNSAPYLLYTFVRTQSLLKKAKQSMEKINDMTIKEFEEFIILQDELLLLRLLHQFPQVIEKAAINFAPNLIANYLYNLAQKFNLFYQKYPIIKEKEPIRNLRLAIAIATGKIIKNGLYLLGSKTVEKM